MIYLSLDDLLMLHALVINHSGGALQIRDIGRLESAIATQHQEVFGEVLYELLHQKAAAVCRGIICDHPFTDGNKRTGMLACITLLELNGLSFKVTDKQLEYFAVNVAVNKPSVDDIAQWLKANSA